MNAADRQQVVDIAKLTAREFFDDYLTNVHPRMQAVQMSNHNTDIKAHPIQFGAASKTERRVNRVLWMLSGACVILGIGIGRFSDILKIFL